MVSIAQSALQPIPVPSEHHCPADCDVRDALLCWLAEERRLRADLRLTGGSVDAEVLAVDLRAAERQIDLLLAIGQEERR